jgi:hypothetical protein
MDTRIERLRAVRRLETEEQMQEFDELLDNLGEEDSNDPALLSDLLRTFIDDTKGREQMWGLLHYVEAFPVEIYVPTLVQVLPEMRSLARKWGVLLLLRVLNNPTWRLDLREVYRKLPNSDQQQLVEVLTEVARESSDLARKVAEVTTP